MPNQFASAGVVNRLVSSVVFDSAPELNILPSSMGRPMIRFARDGNSVTYLPTAVSAAQSPEPYMMCTISVALVKTMSLAAAFEARLRSNALLGLITVRPDVTEGIGAFDISQCSIETVGELAFDGSSADYPIVLRGLYPINSGLFP